MSYQLASPVAVQSMSAVVSVTPASAMFVGGLSVGGGVPVTQLEPSQCDPGGQMHVPSKHVRPPVHGDVQMSEHCPLMHAWLAAHRLTHWLFTQLWHAPHPAPQPPPGATHWLFTHCWPAAHRLEHTPLRHCSQAPHPPAQPPAPTQTPFWHVCPVGHVTPRHGSEPATHWPPTQCCPAGHVTPAQGSEPGGLVADWPRAMSTSPTPPSTAAPPTMASSRPFGAVVVAARPKWPLAGFTGVATKRPAALAGARTGRCAKPVLMPETVHRRRSLQPPQPRSSARAGRASRGRSR